jgi:predicted ATP-grasp superfamily ATP-dependent carboligase
VSERPPAILLGGGVVALSVARGLSAAGVPVIGLGHREDPLRHSRRRAEFVDSGSGEDVQGNWLEWLRAGPGAGAVIPCSDDGLELIAGERAGLVEFGYAPAEADDEVVAAMLDKARTAELAEAAGIDVPRTAVVERGAPLGELLDGFAFPCALKPRRSHHFTRHFGMRTKLIVVSSPDELERELSGLPQGLEMIATEIVPGPELFSSYYTYVDEAGEPLFHYTKRKLRQFPIHFGLGTYHRSDWDSEVAEEGLRFFRSIGLRGLGCVEFKRDERDERLKLIECNHRITAADALQRACGLELGRLVYERALGLPVTPPGAEFRRGVGLWFPAEDTRAFLCYRRAGELSTAAWLRSLAAPVCFPIASLADPAPAIVAALRRVGRALRRLLPG